MKLKWNIGAFEEIRRHGNVQADLVSRAQRIKTACGDGYEVGSMQGKTRARASVITASYQAKRDNARNNTMLRNINAGR